MMPSSYNTLLLIVILVLSITSTTVAFVVRLQTTHEIIGCGGVHIPLARHQHQLFVFAKSNIDDVDGNDISPLSAKDRRMFLHSRIAAPAAASISLLLSNERSVALAASESGGKCAPEDVLCRQKAYDAYMDSLEDIPDLPPAQSIPRVTNRITYVVQMIIDIGAKRDNFNAGYIRFGLYGDDAQESVKQMLFFLTKGITSIDQKTLQDRLEVDYMPVSLGGGSGAVQTICPGNGIEFGVPSQSKAYALSKGARSAGPNFVPQNRPILTLEGEKFPRPHDCAGLISIPARGIGYNNDSTALDEIYSSAFTITDAPLPALDKPSRTKQSAQQQPSSRVIGQIIDDESMQFLERLATLPVQKKLGKGGSSGPPLLKVRVRDVDVQKVK